MDYPWITASLWEVVVPKEISAMLWFTAGAYIMGYAILKLKKTEKNEEKEADKKQETGEEWQLS